MIRSPFVSVLTPVYNGEDFIADCIESVLAQDYSNWEYIVVNNCSTDRTRVLAEEFARRDCRIRIVNNKAFVGCIENYNNACRQISDRSEYCKVISADDRLLPEALGKFVRLAVRNPTVGIVGSYQRSAGRIRWTGLKENVSVLPGREICRMGLLQGVHVFGNPTSVLYRSDLIRTASSFFPHSEPHADTSACYQYLADCDFGFIHEVLSVERVHENQLSSEVQRLGADYFAYAQILMQYGPTYLTEAELAIRRREVLNNYYRMLGSCVLKMKRQDFWEFHKARLRSIGYTLDGRRIFVEAVRELASELPTPLRALRKFKSALAERNRFEKRRKKVGV